MVLYVKIKNSTFGSIIEEKVKLHHLPISEHSGLKVVFWAIPSFGLSKDFNVSSKVFELMTSALAYIKCQVIFHNTARDRMWYSGNFGFLSFYFPPLELVHRVMGVMVMKPNFEERLIDRQPGRRTRLYFHIHWRKRLYFDSQEWFCIYFFFITITSEFFIPLFIFFSSLIDIIVSFEISDP